ncbi:MAG: hypothetical protein JNJ77_04640 [Planctomycetia bacterium]|nr:hypothetical protein [Planctomycetia bacterium]
MRFTLSSLVLILSITVATADVSAADEKVNCQKGRCSVLFPAKPKLESSKNNEQYVLSEDNGKKGYVLNVSMFNSKINLQDEEKVKKALDTAYLGTKASLGGTKASKMLKSTIGTDKLPTRYYEFTLDDGGIYYTRHVLREDCLIQITISGPLVWAKGEQAQAFMKSLRVEAGK